jgi:hypothetical protein
VGGFCTPKGLAFNAMAHLENEGLRFMTGHISSFFSEFENTYRLKSTTV